MSEKLSKNLGKIRELLKNFQEICRVCEEKSTDMLHINSQNIKHMLKVCTSVTVSQTCNLNYVKFTRLRTFKLRVFLNFDFEV